MSKYFISKNFDFNYFLGLKGIPFIPQKVFDALMKQEYLNPKKLNSAFRKWKVAFIFSTDRKLNNRDVVVSGEYDYEKDKVEIIITSKRGIGFVNMNAYKKAKIAHETILTIMHEMIHRLQFLHRGDYNDKHYQFKRTGNHKLNEEYEYYSDVDEVAAFSHCIYHELKEEFPNQSIGDIIKRREYHSPILIGYKSMYDHKSDTMIELYRSLFRWERKYNDFNTRISQSCGC